MDRILVIDDDSVTLEVLPALLRGRLPDMMIDTASNAQDALAAVQQRRYDLIFIDVHMPGMDGLTFLRRLRTYAQDSRILVFTGDVNESLEAEASEAGAYGFLTKPAFPDLIIAKVRAALRRTP